MNAEPSVLRVTDYSPGLARSTNETSISSLVPTMPSAAEGGDLLLDGRSTVKMKDYGLKPPSAALGMVGTKDEMEVSFVLRARPESQ